MISSSRLRLCSLVVLLGLAAGVGAADDALDSIMYSMPTIAEGRTVFVLENATKQLWLRALERPNVEMRCKGAVAFIKAKQRGYKGLELAIEPLRGIIARNE